MSEGSLIDNVGVVSEDAPPGMQQAASPRPGMEEAMPGPSARASKNQKHKGRRQMDDDFMMRLYKIKLCTRTTPHNWKLCPWAHPGETAALRRDPATHMAEMCPAVRQHQECPHGDGCLYSRNTFECWLHPHRYRTTMCSSGEACTRNICFFAHNEAELRTAPDAAGTTAQQQWGLPCADMDASQLLLDAMPAQPQQLASNAAALAPASSHSAPLPMSCLAAPWCAPVAPGSITPALAACTQAQQPQVQVQQMLLQQAHAAGLTSPAAATAPLPGVLGCLPVSAGVGASLGVAPVSQGAVMLPAGQQQQLANKQFSPAAPTYNISATAGMYTAHSQTSSMSSVVSIGPSPGNSVSEFPVVALPSPAEQYGAQGLKWHQQQQEEAAAMQHAAMLLQQLQLAGAMDAAAQQLSSDSSCLLAGSSNSSAMQHLSQLSLPDAFSNDSLGALLAHPGYPLTQELGPMGISSGPLLSGTTAAQDMAHLLRLESCGLIQLAPLDDGLQDQRVQQQVTMPMAHPGRYW